MKTATMKPRLCLDCNEELIGRIDQKFCSDQCRVNYHNVKAQKRNRIFRKINLILAKNRTILKEVAGQAEANISKTELIDKGYNFKYYTHQVKDKGKLATVCYDYGFCYISRLFIHVFPC
jgi:hypothetical protein